MTHTELFDSVVDRIIEYVPETEKPFVFEGLFDSFHGMGWDTFHHSKYYNPHIRDLLLRRYLF